MQFAVQLTEQDVEAGYAIVSGRVVARYNGSNSIASIYNRTIQLESWRALELNIAPAQNQSAWISQVGECTLLWQGHGSTYMPADSLLHCAHADTVVQFVLTAANK